MELNEEQAKKIIERLYSNPNHWRKKEFRKAYFVLTGQMQIMSEDIAKNVVAKWNDDENRRERVDYVSALLLLSGKWILPKAIVTKRMSSQIKTRYSHGSLDSCSSPVAYRK
ncbi:hypothetical protein [Aliivibrio finisterrensis]|uniref:Uncharacterized protein n=1 Tax=Aliivibrio finisterrensis TaxID=511998 RepID=A0ABY0I625_9GAMM|nr:hypothetical protein [Aliivibrio finisterrensis]RYU63865.1 hypothetical protein ERW53_11790 [Aliivibrio finisterrensis]RYU82951.1 hypothetical protein ERW52_13845 [Aliivibrio finisterrensis]